MFNLNDRFRSAATAAAAAVFIFGYFGREVFVWVFFYNIFYTGKKKKSMIFLPYFLASLYSCLWNHNLSTKSPACHSVIGIVVISSPEIMGVIP